MSGEAAAAQVRGVLLALGPDHQVTRHVGCSPSYDALSPAELAELIAALGSITARLQETGSQ